MTSEQVGIQEEETTPLRPPSVRWEQAWDARAHMRWVGVSACLVSAALTIASAALIALGF